MAGSFRGGLRFGLVPWFCLAAMIVTMFCLGCGGGDSSPPTSATPPGPTPMPSMPPPGMSSPSPSMPGPSPTTDATAEQPKAEDDGTIPDDVTLWGGPEGVQRYYRARWQGHPKLKEAVAYVITRFAGSRNKEYIERASLLLTKLLKRDQPAPALAAGSSPPGSTPTMPGSMPGMGSPGMGSMPYAGGPSPPPTASSMYGGSSSGPGMPGSTDPNQAKPLAPETMVAMIHGLARLGGRTARQSQRDLISGTLKTDDDRTSTMAALQTMVLFPYEESEQILLTAVLAPESLRPPEKPQSGMSGSSPSSPGSSPSYPGSSPSYPGMSSPGMSSPYPGSSPYGGGASGQRVTAAELQQMALNLVLPSASEEVRVKIAQYVARPTTTPEQKNLLGSFLLQPMPENLAAQIILHRGFPKETQAALEEQFTRYSSNALAALLNAPPRKIPDAAHGTQGSGSPYGPGGMGSSPSGTSGPAPYSMPGATGPGPSGQPQFGQASGSTPSGMASPYGPGPGAQPGMMPGMAGAAGMMQGAAPGMAVESPTGLGALLGFGGMKSSSASSELPHRVAKQLWAGTFSTVIDSRLRSAEAMDGVAPVVIMASTVPTDAMRSKLHGFLANHWEEGPSGLEAAGLTTRVFNDPGFLVVLKSQKRKDPQVQSAVSIARSTLRKRSRDPNNPSGMPGAQGPGMPGGMDSMPGAGKQQGGSVEEEWMAICESMARGMCEQFGAAAKMGGGQKELADSKPFELPPSVDIDGEYHFNWPGGITGKQKLAGVPLDPMTVHYVRFERSAKPNVLLSYFKRQLNKPVEHPVENGYWMESFRSLPDSDRILSIDVFISKQGAARRPAGGQQPGSTAGPGGMMMPGGSPSPTFGDRRGQQPGHGQPGYGQPGSGGERPKVERADRDLLSDLVVEIMAIEVKSPAGG